jgi:malonyl-CoA O-methyltransferase
MSTVLKEFSRFAHTYDHYNTIQRSVAKTLADMITTTPQRIVDLGAGSGTFYNTITWNVDHYLAIDSAQTMLDHHPSNPNVEKLLYDFNDESLFEHLKIQPFDHLVSASALQWSSNLEATCQQIKALNIPFSLAIFTNNTFKTLHKTARVTSPIRSPQSIADACKLPYTLKQYELTFEKKEDIFTYIKKSGVSGGKQQLSFSAMKRLLKEYPLDHLEFEVMFIHSEKENT